MFKTKKEIFFLQDFITTANSDNREEKYPFVPIRKTRYLKFQIIEHVAGEIPLVKLDIYGCYCQGKLTAIPVTVISFALRQEIHQLKKYLIMHPYL